MVSLFLPLFFLLLSSRYTLSPMSISVSSLKNSVSVSGSASSVVVCVLSVGVSPVCCSPVITFGVLLEHPAMRSSAMIPSTVIIIVLFVFFMLFTLVPFLNLCLLVLELLHCFELQFFFLGCFLSSLSLFLLLS